MTVPDLTLRIADSSGVLQAVPGLRRFGTARGRSSQLDRFPAGTMACVMSNAGREFDTEHAASPYADLLKPWREIELLASWSGGADQHVFRGFTSGFPQQYDPPNDAVCLLSAVDAFELFAGIDLGATAWEHALSRLAPAHYYRLGETGSTAHDSAGSVDGAYTGGITQGAASCVPTDDQNLAVSFADTAGTSKRVQFTPVVDLAGEWSLSLWVNVTTLAAYLPLFTQFDGTNWLTVYLNPIGGQLYAEYGTPASAGLYIHNDATNFAGSGDRHIVVAWDGSAMTMHVDGGPSSAFQSGSTAISWTPPVMAALGQFPGLGGASSDSAGLDEFAVFDYALSADQAALLYEAGGNAWAGDTWDERIGRLLELEGWPSVDTDVDAGSSALQSAASLGGTLLAHMQECERAEKGLLFMTRAGVVRGISRDSLAKAPYNTPQNTFGDAPGELPYRSVEPDYGAHTVYNDIVASSQGQPTQRATDVEDSDLPFRRTLTLSGLLNASAAVVRGLAQALLGKYKTARLRFKSMTVSPHSDEAALFPVLLSAELGDRQLVRRRPQGVGSAIEQEAVVEREAVTGTPGEWSWSLSLGQPDPSYWLLGTPGFSELGTSTRLGV